MSREMCGTVEVDTALTIIDPCLMMPPSSYSRPTMYPVVLWRKSRGVACRLAIWMNCVTFCASSLKITPLALAMMPTG